jgi:hypothetical protein
MGYFLSGCNILPYPYTYVGNIDNSRKINLKFIRALSQKC